MMTLFVENEVIRAADFTPRAMMLAQYDATGVQATTASAIARYRVRSGATYGLFRGIAACWKPGGADAPP